MRSSALKLLAWSRADLIRLVGGLDDEIRSGRTELSAGISMGSEALAERMVLWERIGYPFPENEEICSVDPFERLPPSGPFQFPASAGWRQPRGRLEEIWSRAKARSPSGMRGPYGTHPQGTWVISTNVWGHPYTKIQVTWCKNKTRWLPWHRP
jgi:hypothetical protein